MVQLLVEPFLFNPKTKKMTQKERHMKEFFEWISKNHYDLEFIYVAFVPSEVKEKMPFTMFAICKYCETLDEEKIFDYIKVKKK